MGTVQYAPNKRHRPEQGLKIPAQGEAKHTDLDNATRPSMNAQIQTTPRKGNDKKYSQQGQASTHLPRQGLELPGQSEGIEPTVLPNKTQRPTFAKTWWKGFSP